MQRTFQSSNHSPLCNHSKALSHVTFKCHKKITTCPRTQKRVSDALAGTANAEAVTDRMSTVLRLEAASKVKGINLLEQAAAKGKTRSELSRAPPLRG